MLMLQSVLDAIRADAAAAFPRECCGLLLGSDGAVHAARPAANVDPQPLHRFAIDPAALIAAHRAARAGGPQVVGYYHSHPRGPGVPSAADRAGAAGDGRIWAILGADGAIGCWRDDPGGFTPLSHRVIPG